MDQTSAESVKAAMDRVALNYGRIDVLYLNAGMHLALLWASSVFESTFCLLMCTLLA